jgi:hypothetical protein
MDRSGVSFQLASSAHFQFPTFLERAFWQAGSLPGVRLNGGRELASEEPGGTLIAVHLVEAP